MRLILFFGCLLICGIVLYLLAEGAGEEVTYPTDKAPTGVRLESDWPAPTDSSPLAELQRETQSPRPSANLGVLECIVVDSSGAPVPEAVISLISSGKHVGESITNENGVALLEIARQSKGAVVARKTNSLGTRWVSALTAFAINERQSLRLALTQETASLMGVVLEGGAPAPGIRVIVAGQSSLAEQTTNHAGIFQIVNLPSEEELPILCVKNGFTYPQDPVTLASSETALLIYDLGSSSLTVHLDCGTHSEGLEKMFVSLSPVHSWRGDYDTLRAHPTDGVALFSPLPPGEYFISAKIPWPASASGREFCALGSTVLVGDSDSDVVLECPGHGQIELSVVNLLEDNIALEYWFEFPDTSYSRDFRGIDFVMFREGRSTPIHVPATPCKLFLNYPAMGILEIPLDMVADEFLSMEVSFPSSNHLVTVSHLPDGLKGGWLVLQNEKGQFVSSTSLRHFKINASFQEDRSAAEAQPESTQSQIHDVGKVPTGIYRVGLIVGATSSWSEYRAMSADTNFDYSDLRH